MRNVTDAYTCYKQCLGLDDLECMALTWNKANECWLNNGDAATVHYIRRERVRLEERV